ncbi:MAG: 23S rRNA (adenine(2503)-C(2))-methyltransferase RlmN [Treponema sp.]|jgi:23S rRNA (adenine2503-C2)-methyltransferase|nr:23S rRNA (adenine(2503)-C(2))-methyltransferase RlmN [Treponema sp.]
MSLLFPPDPYGKPALSGLPLDELIEVLKPLPAFRGRQIFRWIAGGASAFEHMTNLPRSLREELAGRFRVYSSAAAARFEDPDGTVKLQIRLRDGARIEAVLLSDGGDGSSRRGDGPRKTACLSTQAGCPAGCVFCKTGKLGFLRNLDSSEITEQFLFLRGLVPGISNIVIMGMGEPLLNLEELRRALSVLTDSRGLGLSPRRITLSSSGITAGIRDLADRGPGIRLALSLTTADGDLRQRLMPIGRANPLPELKEALRYYQRKGGGRITLEAVLLSGVNTRREDAAALIAFAKGLDAVVNLIPWNPIGGMEFEGKPLMEPSPKETGDFIRLLERGGLNVTRRFRRGRSIGGACGQLGALLPEEPGKKGLEKADEKPQQGAENVYPF